LRVAVIDRDAPRYEASVAVDGVDEVVTISTPTEHFEAHIAADALRGLIEREQPSLVLLTHSVDSMGFAPAVAVAVGAGFASDALSVAWEDGPVVTRGAYGDKLIAEVDFPGKATVIVMIRPGAYAPEPLSQAKIPVRALDLPLGEPRSEHREFIEPTTGDVDITKAEFLLSIGRGVEDQENVARFEALAERLGATLSSSRPLVDAGWMPSGRQVGQSGKTVKPRLYVALGISGAVQHLAGIRGAETIVAVNRDPNAPIFKVADYGAVADLFEVADELEALLG
jgi:electron transfer flavoprotein alpha subunit